MEQQMSNPVAEPFFPRFTLTGDQRATLANAARALPEEKRRAFRASVHRTLRASRAHNAVSDHLIRVAVASVQRTRA
jgi:hypothetical protein